MNFPLTQSAFRAPREILVRDTLAHLRLADRMPLRVRCLCLAYWDDQALDQLQTEREVELGTFGSLPGAMALVVSSIILGHIAAGRDPDLRLVPQFVTILDAEGCLVLAGKVQSGGVRWCDPVRCDAEARQVVGHACRLRADAGNAEATGDAAGAEVLRSQARALEGRLVDPFWRDLAHGAVDRALAA
ncbi:MAG: hypothetical protein B7Z15_22855 [Rhizobiales bacterium 32-66-8]|nr:MAG: hypothetical protein B7Z15_22855 [Rhizobiales bacterium 32-66-8]